MARPLFVLGAVKTYDAGSDVFPDRRRTEYLVASRYLNEARSYGFPPNREKQGLLLLGKSLVETYQTDQGIEVLTTALDVEPRKGGAAQPGHSSPAGRSLHAAFKARLRTGPDRT